MIASGLTDRLAGHLPVSIPTGIHPLERSTADPLCLDVVTFVGKLSKQVEGICP